MLKNIVIAICVLCCFLSNNTQAFGQGHASFCGMEAIPELEPLIKTSPDNYLKDGMTITAHGELKVLMVLIEFKDETWEPRHPYWPTQPATPGQPIEAPYWVDGSAGSGSLFLEPHAPIANRLPFSVTDYMYEMSKTQPNPLRMHGSVVRVILPFTAEQAASDGNLTRTFGVKWALEKVDQTLGANGGLDMFDMWTSDGSGTNVAAPDDNLDLVICAMRAPSRYPQFSNGLTAQNWLVKSQVPLPLQGGRLYLPVSGKWVGNAGSEGSSIFLNNWLEPEGDYAHPMGSRITGMKKGEFRVLIHELGHLFLTFNHYQSGPWTLLSNDDDRAYCPDAMQMCMLGWASPVVLGFTTEYDSDFTLGDLYTTGQCIAIEGDPSNSSSTYFFIENHQFISPYDYTARPDYDAQRASYRGVYVLRGNGAASHNIESASGRFSWTSVANKFVDWGSTQFVPVLVPSTTYNQDGYSRSELVGYQGVLLPSGSRQPAPVLYSRIGNEDVFVNWFGGSEPVDQFLPCGESADWTPTSRTPSHYPKWNFGSQSLVQQASRASMRVKSFTGTTANLRLANQWLDITPPKRVSTFSIASMTSDGNDDNMSLPVVVTVVVNVPSPNTESDFAGYCLRGRGDVHPLSGNTFSFTETIPAGAYAVGFQTNVHAQDLRGNRSCQSEIDDIDILIVRQFSQQSKRSLPQSDILSAGSKLDIIQATYPNPVDDMFTIAISDGSLAVLDVAIIDMAGRVISTDHRVARSDNKTLITVSASDLITGTWRYRIRTPHQLIWGGFIKH